MEKQLIDLEILLSAIKIKDKKAFNLLYEETINRVYSLALKITHRQDLADEVVSDVYLQVWQQAQQYNQERGGVLPWIMVMCRSRALDLLRKRQRIMEKSGELSAETLGQKEQQQDLLASLDNHAIIHKALRKLENQQRQLLSLAYFRGYSHNEMALVTGIPLGTIKTNLRQSLVIMKDYIDNLQH